MDRYDYVAQAGPVRVSRNGNSRTLAVPAEIVKQAHIEIGDQYTVEAFGSDLVFRRVNTWLSYNAVVCTFRRVGGGVRQ